MGSEDSYLRYQPGGTLNRDAFYIARAADAALLASLRACELCYVLAPRQIGKSSLRVRTQVRLEADGVRCATLDLSNFGTGASEEEWYASLVGELSDQLKLTGLEQFWLSTDGFAPVHRFERYIRQEILNRITGKVVIFVDEIDLLRRVSIRRGDFLAVLRALYNSRHDEPALNRLGLCLIGVATPGELIEDPARTPFNVGRAIDLEDFSRAEVDLLSSGLDVVGGSAVVAGWLLDAVYDWTDGHPYQTQLLCSKLAESTPLHTLNTLEDAEARVRALVEELFPRAQDETSLSSSENRFTDKDAPVSVIQKISLYRRLLLGDIIASDRHSRLHTELRLAGLVKDVRSPEGDLILRLRNRIVKQVFDRDWLRMQSNNVNLSDALVRWKDAGKAEDLLLRGIELTDAMQFAEGRESETDEQEYLRASLDLRNREAQEKSALADLRNREAQEKRALAELRSRDEQEKRTLAELHSRRLRRVLFGLASITLLLICSLLITISFISQARQAEQRAKNSQDIAEKEEQRAVAALSTAEQEKRKAKEAQAAAEKATFVAEAERAKAQIALSAESQAKESLAAALASELDVKKALETRLAKVSGAENGTKSASINDSIKGVRPVARTVSQILAAIDQARKDVSIEKARVEAAETELEKTKILLDSEKKRRRRLEEIYQPKKKP